MSIESLRDIRSMTFTESTASYMCIYDVYTFAVGRMENNLKEHKISASSSNETISLVNRDISVRHEQCNMRNMFN